MSEGVRASILDYVHSVADRWVFFFWLNTTQKSEFYQVRSEPLSYVVYDRIFIRHVSARHDGQIGIRAMRVRVTGIVQNKIEDSDGGAYIEWKDIQDPN